MVNQSSRYVLNNFTSPSKIWVATSIPVFAGIYNGVGGLSKKASVCVEISASSTRSVSSSKYSSVCTSICFLPSTGSGVRGLSWALARFLAIALLLASCCFWISMGSGCAVYCEKKNGYSDYKFCENSRQNEHNTSQYLPVKQKQTKSYLIYCLWLISVLKRFYTLANRRL